MSTHLVRFDTLTTPSPMTSAVAVNSVPPLPNGRTYNDGGAEIAYDDAVGTQFNDPCPAALAIFNPLHSNKVVHIRDIRWRVMGVSPIWNQLSTVHFSAGVDGNFTGATVAPPRIQHTLALTTDLLGGVIVPVSPMDSDDASLPSSIHVYKLSDVPTSESVVRGFTGHRGVSGSDLGGNNSLTYFQMKCRSRGDSRSLYSPALHSTRNSGTQPIVVRAGETLVLYGTWASATEGINCRIDVVGYIKVNGVMYRFSDVSLEHGAGIISIQNDTGSGLTVEVYHLEAQNSLGNWYTPHIVNWNNSATPVRHITHSYVDWEPIQAVQEGIDATVTDFDSNDSLPTAIVVKHTALVTPTLLNTTYRPKQLTYWADPRYRIGLQHRSSQQPADSPFWVTSDRNMKGAFPLGNGYSHRLNPGEGLALINRFLVSIMVYEGDVTFTVEDEVSEPGSGVAPVARAFA